jgi:hypothetical protein
VNRPIRALIVLALLGPACDRDPPAEPPAPSLAAVTVDLPPPPERLRFRTDSDGQRIGLPAGCRLELPTRSSPLPAGEIRFLTAPHRGDDLVLAARTAGAPLKAGVFAVPDAARPRAFPWADLDNPPPAARHDAGWLAVVPLPGEALQTLGLWWEGRPAEPLARGDRLVATDLHCAGDACALLTSRVSRAAGDGASVFLGSASGPASTWRRLEVPPEAADGTAPLAILEASAGRARVALSTAEGIEIWSASPEKSVREATLAVTHSAYDVFQADIAVAITAGASIAEPCRKDGFPLRIERFDGQHFPVTIPVPPDALVTRRLEGGFFVAWISSVSCRLTERTMVHGLLLDDRGAPRSSAMAIADATAFALSAEKRRVDLWLQRGARLIWASGACHPAPSPQGALVPGVSPTAPPPPGPLPTGSAFKSPAR